MRLQTAFTALSMANTILGHSAISTLYINGANQGDAVCLRMNSSPSAWSNPLEDLSSPNLACGVDGTKGVARVCPVPDGATLTFEWREDANKPGGSVIDVSHMGPCAAYMKRVDSAATDGAAGDGWFKIWHEGYDEKASKWCTQKLRENGGFLSVPLPQGLAGGDYLVRAELLALHEANHGDPQYYVGCAQIFLQSSGRLVPAETVAIPGYVSATDKADSYNIYNKPLALPYPLPGPGIASLKNGVAVNNKAAQQTDGAKPEGCILESGSNFCGIEVVSYSDEAGCNKASDDCWKQASACYASAPATGDGACRIWEQKCQDIQETCGSGASGPPNKGKVLTPAKKNLASIPAPLGPVERPGTSENSPANSPAPSLVASPEKPSFSSLAAPSSSDVTSPAKSPVSGPAAPGSTLSTSCSSYAKSASQSIRASKGRQTHPAGESDGKTGRKAWKIGKGRRHWD